MIHLEPKVYIVVINWNSWSETSTCLSSLQGLRYENYRVVVVDNGSTDNSATRIETCFPLVQVVRAGTNLGFPGGCNCGIRRALSDGADYVWLLNNDTKVDALALRALVDKAEIDSRTGAVGSAIYSMELPNELQAWGGGYVNFWLGRARHFVKAVSDDRVQYITGASLLIRRQALESVGLLDETIFLYWDDPEYCWRLRKSGWRLAVAGNSKIWHKGMSAHGRGSVRSDIFYNRSATQFFGRYSPIPFVSVWIGVMLRVIKRLMERDWDRARATWVAVKEVRHRG